MLLQVLSLFQDNFDYGDIRRDFVHGVLTSDLLMKNIYCYIAKEGYAARVQDTRSYDAIRFVLMTFLPPISCHCVARLARTFSPGGHSRWCLTIITQVDKHMIICVVTNMFPRTTRSSSPGQCLNPSRVLSSLTDKACRTCKIANNTLLGPSTQVHEEAQVITSTIGASCTIGTATVLRNAYLFDNVTIGPNCVLESCIVGAGVQVGEGSSIARGSLVADGVKLGPGTVLRPFDRVSKQRQESDFVSDD